VCSSDLDWQLLPSSRYAQSRRYLLALAADQGLDLVAEQQAPLREDQRQPVPGLYLVLRRPTHPA
jgi:predicted TPR repeat methyltransferase